MQLTRVVEVSRAVAGTGGRNAKVARLAELLRQLTPDEAPVVVAWLAGAARQGRVGIGYSALRAAAGDPAAEPSLDVLDVDRTITEIAEVAGKGSATRRAELLRGLFGRATEAEQRFLMALLIGELRQGALEGVMVDAVAAASGAACEKVRRAVMMAGEVAPVATAVLTAGEAALAGYDIRLFRPVQPMLAQTAEDASAAVEELGEAALEWKLDGARIQVHKGGDEVRVYSRRLNEVTEAVPEVVELVRTMPGDLILDGEVISLQPDGRPQPFQVTMRRFGRKLDVAKMRSELPLQPFFFDALYLDGALVDEAQSRRFAELRRVVPEHAVIPSIVTADKAAAEQFFEDALARGHEGVMAKLASAPYAAGARGQSWLKVKRAKTLDLVILAAEWGSGRREGWLSNLHLGARDTERGGYAMLGKTFKGLTDEMLEWQTRELLKLEIGREGHVVHVEPRIVVEIAFNDLQVSPRYASGLALRFARVKRYRTDKRPEDADTFATVTRIAADTMS